MNQPEKSRGYLLVAGLGRSGVSLAKFLKKKGYDVIATDSNPDCAEAAGKLESLGIKTEVGRHSQKTFDQADLIITSPGIPLDMPFFKKAVNQGVAVTGELDIFSKFNDKPVIAVTGTNGKTTTVTILSEMMEASEIEVFTGGNIGTPLVESLTGEKEPHGVVAEVSSFQLDTSSFFLPRVAVLLNITADHLDRYKDFAAYEKSKWSLFQNQTDQDIAVLHADLPDLAKNMEKIQARPLLFAHGPLPKGYPGAVISESSIRMEDPEGKSKISNFNGMFLDLTRLCIRGAHNRENLAAASLAALASGASIEKIQTVIDAFAGLPHRVAHVGRFQGVDYYNDSKGTNTDAVIRALECFKSGVILILGGREKGTDFTELIPAMISRVRAVIAMGEAVSNIKKSLSGVCPIVASFSMEDAVNQAAGLAVTGETVLLSPACASFDMYKNYGKRGEAFVNCVRSLDRGPHE